MKDIIKSIGFLSSNHSTYDVFSDWVTMYALSISNSVDLSHFNEREDMYMSISKKYSSQEMSKFIFMCSKLINLFDSNKFYDFLGDIYMSLNISNRKSGQFFTPYELCRLMANLSFTEDMDHDKIYTINEPTCGSGGNIISLCEFLYSKGYNYQKNISVVAQDIDLKSCCMAYIQFSLLGIPAIIVHGDTLLHPYTGGFDSNVFFTPMYLFNSYKTSII